MIRNYKSRLVAPVLFSILLGCSSASDDAQIKPEYNVGGTITGLFGSELEIQINNFESITIEKDAKTYQFPSTVTESTLITLKVVKQPIFPDQTCAFDINIDVITSDIDNANIICTDSINPTVANSSPASLTTTKPDIQINFSEPIESTSINENSFQLKIKDTNDIVEGVQFQLDVANARATLPTPLRFETTYSVVVNEGLTDLSGNPLGAQSFDFTTDTGSWRTAYTSGPRTGLSNIDMNSDISEIRFILSDTVKQAGDPAGNPLYFYSYDYNNGMRMLDKTFYSGKFQSAFNNNGAQVLLVNANAVLAQKFSNNAWGGIILNLPTVRERFPQLNSTPNGDIILNYNDTYLSQGVERDQVVNAYYSALDGSWYTKNIRGDFFLAPHLSRLGGTGGMTVYRREGLDGFSSISFNGQWEAAAEEAARYSQGIASSDVVLLFQIAADNSAILIGSTTATDGLFVSNFDPNQAFDQRWSNNQTLVFDKTRNSSKKLVFDHLNNGIFMLAYSNEIRLFFLAQQDPFGLLMGDATVSVSNASIALNKSGEKIITWQDEETDQLSGISYNAFTTTGWSGELAIDYTNTAYDVYPAKQPVSVIDDSNRVTLCWYFETPAEKIISCARRINNTWMAEEELDRFTGPIDQFELTLDPMEHANLLIRSNEQFKFYRLD